MSSWTYIEDIEEKHAPPEKPLLRLSLVGDDLLSVAIVKQGDKDMQYEERAEVIVPAVPVFAALSGMRGERFTRLRERASTGKESDG